MTRSRFTHISSFVLAILMMGSSLGVAVNAHLCGGHVQDVALLSAAETCGPGCEDQQFDAGFHREPCCSNVSVYLLVPVVQKTIEPISTPSDLTPDGGIILCETLRMEGSFVSELTYVRYIPPESRKFIHEQEVLQIWRI